MIFSLASFLNEIAAAERRGYEQAITHLREQAERRRNHPNTQPWDLADARELTYAADYLSARLTEETTP